MVTLELKAFAVVIFFCSFTKIPPPSFAVLEIWEKQQKKRWKSSLCLSFLPVVSGGGEEEKQEEEENVEFSTFHLLFPSSDTELISGKSLRKNKGGEDSSAAGCIVLVGWLSSVGFGIIGYYSFMIKPGAETWSSNIKSYRHVISLN